MRTIITIMLVAFLKLSTQAEVVGWRHNWTGKFPEANPPTSWSTDDGVVWKTKMPGPGNASPVIVGNRVFVCSDPDVLICVDRDDGRILWQHANPVGDLLDPETLAVYKTESKEGRELKTQFDNRKRTLRVAKWRAQRDNVNREETIARIQGEVDALVKKMKECGTFDKYANPSTHGDNGHSTPTPVTDGKHVYTVFGTGVAVCYDLEGNKVWGTFVETPTHEWGHSASPLLVDGKVLIHILNLVALNAENGDEQWRAGLPSYWGSPILTRIGDVNVVMTPHGDVVRVDDGSIVHRGLSKLEFCAPIQEKDVVDYIQAGGKALELPSSIGEEFKTLWTTQPRDDRYFASPIIHQGLVYTMTQNNVFSVIDTANGEIVYSKKLSLGGGKAFPSITMAGEYLYVSNSNGTTLVLKPGRTYREVAKNRLERFQSNPVFQGDKMYLRGKTHMYCIDGSN